MNEKVRLGRWVLNDNNTKLTLSNDNNTQTIDINFLKKNKRGSQGPSLDGSAYLSPGVSYQLSVGGGYD